MLASLRIEAIANLPMARLLQRALGGSIALSQQQLGLPTRYHCAEITGMNASGAMRSRPVRGRMDYTYTNSSGTRGIYVTYILEDDRLYDVAAPKSWTYTERYYCMVSERGEIVRLTPAEAVWWANWYLPDMRDEHERVRASHAENGSRSG